MTLGLGTHGASTFAASSGTVAYSGSGPVVGSGLYATICTVHGTTTPAVTVSSLTDSHGNAWTKLTAATLSTTQFLDAEIWYCAYNIAAGANTLTVNLSGTPTNARAFTEELTAPLGNGLLVPFPAGQTTNTSAGQTSLSVTTTTSAAANPEAIPIGVMVMYNTSAVTITPDTGTIGRDLVSGTSIQCYTEMYGALAATGTATAKWTFPSHRYLAGAVGILIEGPGPHIYVQPNWSAVNRAMYR